MQYQGGKTKISKEISEVLNNALHGRQVPDIDRACRPAEYIYIYIYIYMRSLSSAFSAVRAALRAKSRQSEKYLMISTNT